MVSLTGAYGCRLEGEAPLLQKPKLDKQLKQLAAAAAARLRSAVDTSLRGAVDAHKSATLLAAQRAALMVRRAGHMPWELRCNVTQGSSTAESVTKAHEQKCDRSGRGVQEEKLRIEAEMEAGREGLGALKAEVAALQAAAAAAKAAYDARRAAWRELSKNLSRGALGAPRPLCRRRTCVCLQGSILRSFIKRAGGVQNTQHALAQRSSRRWRATRRRARSARRSARRRRRA